jgi:hypothetical protein
VERFIRGSVYPPQTRILAPKAQQEFRKFVETSCSSFSDVYGGKISAALERQHTRDLFDVKVLLENEGITEEIRKAFIIYLISSENPISHLLRPNHPKVFSKQFENHFNGMTILPITEHDLVEARNAIIKEVNSTLRDNERMFLLSFETGIPNWELLDIKGIEVLPSIQWKLTNIRKRSEKKSAAAVNKLKMTLKI